MKGRFFLGAAGAGMLATSSIVCGTSALHSTSSNAGGTGGAGNASGTMSGGKGGDVNFDGGTTDAALADGCINMPLGAHTIPGNIVVVFDQSDSMSQPFTVPGGGVKGPKWKAAEDALVAAVMPKAATLNLGAIFFPTTQNGTGCSLVAPITQPPQIPITPGTAFVTSFQGHFAAPGWTLLLGTPLQKALDLVDLALPDPSPFPGQRAVVVITDGAPTCKPTAAALEAPVKAMFSRGIKTFVIGLPGSAAAQTVLNGLAKAGGTTSYLSPSDPSALTAALAQIAGSTLDDCTITLNPPATDTTQVHLIVTDAAHPNGEEIPLDSGWTISADGKTATLTGAVCATAKGGGYSSIEFVYGCVQPPH